MDNRYKISIIVPVYNVEKYLPRCIESLINQTYKNLEIILVDDGSTDNSGYICDEYAMKESRIKVIHQKNSGVPTAREKGIEKANGEYIGFVDSDDYVELDMYEYLMSMAEKYKSEIVCCGISRIFSNGRTENTTSISEIEILSREQAFERFQLYDSLACALWNKIYKSEIVKNIKFERLYRNDDAVMLARYIAKANTIAFGTEPKYKYMIRNNSITRNMFNQKSYDILKATDIIYDIFKTQYPNNSIADVDRILWYVVFANEMIIKNGQDKEFVKTLQRMIKEQKKFIMDCAYLNTVRKCQLLLLGKSFNLYKLTYKIYMRMTGKG